MLNAGVPLAKVTRCVIDGGKVNAEVESKIAIVAAELHFTTAPHIENPKRTWTAQLLTIDGTKITGDAPPAEVTAWYISIKDERGAFVSSEVTIR